MHVKERVFETAAYSVEHILDVPNYEKLIADFKVGNDASGLEAYLKYAAVGDEQAKLARTYLVIDKATGELSCYFSLRTGLITVQVAGDDFDSLPAVELSNFAINAIYRKNHKELQKLGVHIFEVFILPIARCMSEYVGANSLYIYALPNDRLIEHYATMGFSLLPPDQERFAQIHVKPKYDMGCRFMYQTL